MRERAGGPERRCLRRAHNCRYSWPLEDGTRSMAGNQDETSWLPSAPPPRPVRRDEAIEAALRKFDGMELPSVRPVPQTTVPLARKHFQRLTAAVSAVFVAAIGIPLAFLALQHQTQTRTPESPKAEFQTRSAPPACTGNSCGQQ